MELTVSPTPMAGVADDVLWEIMRNSGFPTSGPDFLRWRSRCESRYDGIALDDPTIKELLVLRRKSRHMSVTMGSVVDRMIDTR